jgi:DNA-directed RNA polymerase specialized sigma24 family protein
LHLDIAKIKELTLLNSNLDETTFEIIYKTYWVRLYQFAVSKTHDQDVAEEIVQDLFVNLWERKEELKVSNIPSYLFSSVRYKVIDFYKQRLFSDLAEVRETIAPDYPIFLEELQNQLQIFTLNRIEGFSTDEIARDLSLPKRTVEYHITQALKHLRFIVKSAIIHLIFIIFDRII